MQFAPEIMAGVEHDKAVDVWGLGQLTLKLLALTKNQEDHLLRALAESMVQDTPDERPSIGVVCAKIKGMIKGK